MTPVLTILSKEIGALATYKSLRRRLANGKTYIAGLNNIGKLLLLGQIGDEIDKKIIYIIKNESEQAALERELKQLTATPIYTYPDLKSEQINRREYLSNFRTRAATAQAFRNGQTGLFIFSVNALIEPLTIPAPAKSLNQGEGYEPEKILGELILVGYERQTKVFQNGEVAMRGGVLDIFPIGAKHPYRLEFDSRKLVSIIGFDPVSNQTISQYATLDITAIKNEKISHYLLDTIEEQPESYLVIFNQADELFQMLYELYQSGNQHDNGILTTISKQLDKLSAWHFVSIPPTEEGLVRFDIVDAPLFANDLNRLAAEVKKYSQKSWRIILATERERELKVVLEDHQIKFSRDPLDKVSLISTKAPEGLMSPSLKTILLTDKEIFAPITEKSAASKKTPRRRQLAFLAQIEKGDYVVHTDHGIGQLTDIGTIEVNGISREYLTIKYAGADRIYVPVDQIDKVSKYISVAGEKPTLSRLSSQSWKRLVSKIRKESQEFAKELLDLYAKRALREGIAFESSDFWEKALSDSFAHQETPDQEQVIQDILSDMEKPKPMDRLLVADVGFGKTEVAIRAAFKAVTSGFQVAFLAPTTILVEQHLKTFTERLSPFGVQIAALSRFRSPAEQKHIVTGLKTREVDVVIGTHRLLSPDIRFANLGLVIVDEEQRFGVRHKEKLKMLRAEVDVLSLTATPIPRTLNLALSGIRDISVIETPPINRLPIQTTVAPFDMDAAKNAILNEIKRGGQVYFVHNRVATIASITNKLREILPEVRFVYAHGQMPERLLAKIMEDFRGGKYDCLVASTIIENGLDNPNVNTLIIDNAGNFGLSQLHQLRGRIGRGKIQAHAYFYYQAGKLGGSALERLKTIAGHTELGSGYQIALRDLQIRGAGGVLSKRQHGHISAVGLTLYTKLLNRAIEELRTGYRPRVDTITVDLPISAYLPEGYIDNEAQRIKTYQQLALTEDEKELKEAVAELKEKFGELPKEVANLFDLLKLKLDALSTQKISSIIARNIAPSGSPAPEHVANIALISPLKDKNVIAALKSIGIKLADNLLKVPLAAVDGDWIGGIGKIIKLLK
ncbi:transcription-repair coupling factor [candidate division Kazan bacterium RBG_13_50_9]|uniref:Transcription-repair-coupling factor n=1 Tax=candidate division Kazan bacterium RBG_13_50_9 TaxID=1798535 RepID=A0A1F4NTB4_UNCK3|nr:MAG: transcription-repair coupling factor [candidate division Kazan bacterium RBG_13_50_9]